MDHPARGQIAKLTRPRLRDPILRTRLFDALDAALECPVIWVTGPPGAGKTTLTSTFLEARERPVLWYQIDQSDADPATFFYYLGMAARSVSKRQALPVFSPEYMADMEGFARRFFRAFCERLPRNAVVAFDNYQDAPAAAAVHGLMEILAAELRSDLRLIGISRAPVPAPLARMQASDQVALIDWPLLRLTVEEAGAIARSRKLADDDVARQLVERVDGWAAGLTLMLEDVRRGAEQQRSPAFDSRESVFNYFAGVVFDRLIADEQRALLATAFLPQFDANMAQALAGSGAVMALLDRLSQRQLFVYRSGLRNPQFQYHALFREFLVLRAERDLPPEALTAIRARAAALLEESGQSDDAVQMYAEARQWDAVGRIVIAAADSMLAQGRWQTVVGWLERVPGASVERSGDLLLWWGCALEGPDPVEARKKLQKAVEAYARSADDCGQLLALAAIMRTYLAENRDQEEWGLCVERMERLLAQEPRLPSAEAELAITTAYLLAASHVSPAGRSFEAAVLKIGELLRRETVDAGERLRCATQLLIFLCITGRRTEVAELCTLIDRLLALPQVTPLDVALGHLFRGFAEYSVFLRFDAALHRLQQARRIAGQHGLAVVTAAVPQYESEVFVFYDRDRARAKQALREMEALELADHSLVSIFYHSSAMHFAGWEGDLERARSHALRCTELARDCSPAFFILCARQTAHALAEAGDVAGASALIEEVREAARGTCYDNSMAALDLQKAFVAMLKRDEASCARWLGQALSAARDDERQAVGMYLFGIALPRLLARALTSGIEAQFAKELIIALDLPAPRDVPPAWPWPLALRTFGRFEISVRGELLSFGRKAPRKAILLLKVLVALGGRNVPESRLIDALWPDEEGDSAHAAYSMMVTRLRKLLGDARLLIQQGGTLSLNADRCHVDVWAFERTYEQCRQRRDATALGDLVSCYGGTFLAEDLDLPEAAATRERTRSRFLGAVAELGTVLEAQDDLEAALALYQQALDADALAEPLYQGIMRCNAALGRLREAVAAYQRLRQLLDVTLSLRPGAETERLYQSLRGA